MSSTADIARTPLRGSETQQWTECSVWLVESQTPIPKGSLNAAELSNQFRLHAAQRREQLPADFAKLTQHETAVRTAAPSDRSLPPIPRRPLTGCRDGYQQMLSFDAINHEWLIKFLERRIGDSRILRLIRKWLRAGVSEDGEWSPTTVGTPQGAVASPLLANVYLHYVFDLWIQWWRKSCRGDVVMVRYADDFVIGFENHSEATACLEALHTRFAQFGLKLHKDKTRLIEFGRYAIERRERHSESRPETFNFLGFTHKCAQTKEHGRFTIHRHSIAKRVRPFRRSRSNCGNVCIVRSANRAAGCGVLCRAG